MENYFLYIYAACKSLRFAGHSKVEDTRFAFHWLFLILQLANTNTNTISLLQRALATREAWQHTHTLAHRGAATHNSVKNKINEILMQI